LTEEWFDNELLPLIHPTIGACPNSFLLSFDCASFHKTLALLKKMKDAKVLPCLIPPGCTGLLQPLDTHINKPFKDYLREENDLYMEKYPLETWSTSDKRVMVTHIVVTAWEKFCTEKKEMVQKSFQDVGLFLPVDGSQDHLINIKGFEEGELVIGDWRHQKEPNYMQYQEMTGDDVDEFVIEADEERKRGCHGISVLTSTCYFWVSQTGSH